MSAWLVFVLCLWALMPVAAQARPATITGSACARDGDTLVVGRITVRLFGVDAFEGGQVCGKLACGTKAKLAIDGMVRHASVTCRRQDVDSYGRVVAICTTSAGVDLGREMVRRGLAVAYRRYSTRYIPDEQWAKQNRQGAWAHGFDSPLTWRRQNPRP